MDAYDVNPLSLQGKRRRCEPGSNSVIVTAPFTGCEGHVLRLGGVLRTRKIFVGCPAIRPIWDQSPGIRNPRLETVGNRLYPIHDQDCLRRFTAEAQIQDRSRKSTGLNTAPGFFASPVIPAHSPVIPAEAGTQRKTKHAIYHPVIPAQPAPYPDTGAGASAGGAPIQRGGANRHASSIWPCDNNIELCKGPIKGEGRWTAFRADFREPLA